MVTLGAIFPVIWDCFFIWCALAISLSLHTPSRLRYFAIAQYAQQVCAGYFAIATYAIAVALFRYRSIRATWARYVLVSLRAYAQPSPLLFIDAPEDLGDDFSRHARTSNDVLFVHTDGMHVFDDLTLR